MFRPTTVHRSGVLAVCLANGALLFNHYLQTSSSGYLLLLKSGVFFKLCLPTNLLSSIYGDQQVSRVANALPELNETFITYKKGMQHPRTTVWEKKMITQKLRNDRERIFHTYRTSNFRMYMPYVLSASTSLYCLAGGPAQEVYTFLREQAGLTDFSAPWAVPGVLDPTLLLAMGLTAVNVNSHLNRRKGFNKDFDRIIAVLKKLNWLWMISLMGVTVGYGPLFPAYVAPVWLGMSLVQCLKNQFLCVTPGRRLLQVDDYPPSHGHYTEATAEAHPYRLLFSSTDGTEGMDRDRMWALQKKALEYECDVRLYKMARRLGVLGDEVAELEYEVDKLKRKRRVVRERKQKGIEEEEDVYDAKTYAYRYMDDFHVQQQGGSPEVENRDTPSDRK
ncbi:hypothetical protein AGDE_08729 [Angomonas deanei]|uniref:60Kd inner membrane protein n=1 Tax=Angomonas deanei TaxID=59799 RepID=A0A7G2CQM8_9TRYP|nr:hypothetical protein AGDE_08729 [Angomonas deanei]CAD2221689.1 hypothetical protein, conserved [Angomonas deanei]|eukprot:EPY32365.1 hypothetical protein AGDE_08729 [Angomonas deanei]